MFNTVSRKKVAIFGFAFKKDTGDTRETPAIDVCKGLIRDGGKCCVFDPQVSADQVGDQGGGRTAHRSHITPGREAWRCSIPKRC
eukprot:365277-Chlamydomonas_euryale.AAC.1